MLSAIIGYGYAGGLLVAAILGVVLWIDSEREMFKRHDWPHLE